MEGGFELRPGESVNVTAEYYATIWGRNGCLFDHSGHGTCVTGDCGGVLRCAEATQNMIPVLPVTYAVLNFYNVLPDFYAVSVANGFNLPMSILPYGHPAGAGQCNASSCFTDLNQICPSELQVRSNGSNGQIVVRKSPCVAFNKPEFCCPSVAHFPEDPPTDESCKPTRYSAAFQAACPTALVHSTLDWMRFGCDDANYLISFC
ncbi:hypothetical protein P3X46_017463 [Hevea brasiliensis]|uniref:Thaumatin-like protein n=1 Tax=Hevea brasiliensis TaxID=3981 RepID=A0ABQ9LRF9_HEVBR|nr:pathogenesis-related thaumatin-like protein 3.5 [Hevea brasiliensis]KAJ9169253.1 hypothetical protein P3X46_017463 [Hevea brasiliensis]